MFWHVMDLVTEVLPGVATVIWWYTPGTCSQQHNN